MNMRKIIAVLAAVLLLCAAIPMAAISVSAAANLLPNGTFDSNTSGWGQSTNTVLDISEGTLKATHSDDWAYVYTWATVTANTDYTISFKAKADKGGFAVNLKSGWGSTDLITKLSPSITTEWKEYTFNFNTGDYSGTLLIFFNSNQYGSAHQSIWLDDVVVAEKKEEPVVPELPEYAGDIIIEKNFDDGSAFSNGSNENGYMVFDATTADWANVYLYANALQNATKYVISFDAKADKATNVNVKINNNWKGDTFKWTTNVTTEWATYSCVITTNELAELTSTALLMFTSNTYASSGAVYHIDNVVVRAYVDPSVPAEPIYSEDFEDGALGGWSSSTSSVVAAADLPVANADGGNYALKFVSTNYSYTNYSLAVEKNTTYRVQYSILSGEASRPLNARIRTNGSVDLAYNQHAGSTTAWQTFTLLFNSGDNTSLNFRFQSAHTTCTYYIDNLSVTPVDATQKDDGYIKNGDFESGMADNWDYTPSASYVENPNGEGYVLKTNETAKVNMLAQPVNIVAGKEYVLFFNVYGYSTASNSAIFVRLGAPANTTWDVNGIQTSMAAVGGDASDTWTRQVRLNMNSNTGKWCYVAVPFTAAKTTTINASIYNYRENEGKYYFDNFVVFEKKAASNDGFIVNGDFETGTTEGLSVSGQTIVSPSAAKDGNFGLHMKNQSGGWGGVGQWSIAGLEVGATYKLEMDMKAISKGHNWTLWQGAYNSGTKYASGYFATAEWTHIEKEFVANEATAVLNINGGNAGVSEDVYLDNLKLTKIKDAHVHEYVGTETKAPTCGEAGVMTYACSCGEGTYTEEIPATGEHVYFDDCSAICEVCGYEREAGHNVIHAPAKDATCTELGNIEYWYCDVCGMAWLDEACIMNTNMMAVKLPMAEHVYFYACDPVCMNCYEITNPDAAHSLSHVEAVAATCYENGNIEYWTCEHCGGCWDNENATGMPLNHMSVVVPMGHGTITHVEAVAPTCYENGNIEYWYCEACGQAWLDEACTLNTNLLAVVLPMGHGTITHVEAKDATCTELGNIEYWYCEACGQAWLDEACTLNTNQMAVKLPMVDHTYDNEFDADCNACGAVRVAAQLPYEFGGNSRSEDVSGLAFKFTLEIEGIAIKSNTWNQADFTNAFMDGYKVIGVGAIASNSKSEINIKGVHIHEMNDDGTVSFAYRIINIPEANYGDQITMTPYFIVEIDGVETTVYGEARVATYNG